MADWVLSVLMLAGAGLLFGGIYILFTGKSKKQGILMLLASLVMFLNVAIWTVPTPTADAPRNEAPASDSGTLG